jgi:hypothetical protein
MLLLSGSQQFRARVPLLRPIDFKRIESHVRRRVAEQSKLVLFCCNGTRGYASGFCHDVAVDEWDLELQAPLLCSARRRDRYACTRQGITITGRTFPHHGYSRHVGSLFWDGALMRPRSLVALLNHLRAIGWSCSSGPQEIVDRWEQRATPAFHSADLMRLTLLREACHV